MAVALRTNAAIPAEMVSNLFSASIMEEPTTSPNLPGLLHHFPVLRTSSGPIKGTHPLLGNFSDYMATLKGPTSVTGESLLTNERIGLTLLRSSPQGFNPLSLGLFFLMPE